MVHSMRGTSGRHPRHAGAGIVPLPLGPREARHGLRHSGGTGYVRGAGARHARNRHAPRSAGARFAPGPRHVRHRRVGRTAVRLSLVTLVALLASLYLATSTGQKDDALGPLPSQLSTPAPGSSTSSTPVGPVSSIASNPAPPTTMSKAPLTAPPTTSRPRAPRTAPPPSASPPAPVAKPHVMVIMMENQTYGTVIGNGGLPYLNGSLVSHYLLLQQLFAVGHPSLPNYLEILSGSTWGVGSDCSPGPGCQGDANLPRQLDQAGISWAGYMESMPVPGYTGGDA